MLPSLADILQADGYYGLLHTANVPVNSSELVQIYDGRGNPAPIKVGNNLLQFGSMGFPTSPGDFGQVLGSDGTDIVFMDVFPIGAVYFTTINVNPETFLGGTWVAVAQGRFVVGVGEGTQAGTSTGTQTKTFTTGDNFGEYEHKLSVSEMPKHTHVIPTGISNFGRTNSANKEVTGQGVAGDGNDWAPTRTEGGDVAHNNLPPGFGLYIWERTA